ncbi:DeoR/GlpR family transcriptional regulator [Photobacterium damselae subsp. piscicida]|uniref:DeoR/GlpR family transcriptional regulator n=1 Tax=Photobacterium damsela subsp. piscicida TaxID=38294 RepID=A0A1Q9H1X7_PHODP|nr:DeoR/GlpR family transcriptional regulator [Photobacterium damselae]NVH47046.1 DeoR/GlpR family transcriptional regulator [Photobacterium damselae subsp. damselae]MBE8128046.1 DeoR/GlpR family transcriptional regulator [Photobacterium damselae subsp. piscicida]MDP2516471.1 DeoR/GlpR family transcriptional regulator [Photobacterium damselae subsp. piscicida]OLQ81883.1 DeoR/GlpR family transcriptional regulator [Photobacterium damselae subsp. piscicida]PSV78994.1 DeoR/GlpR family transcriptio
MKQSKRHQEIIDIVKTQGYVSTEDLVERFNVSPQTIRRDLNELADANQIRRHHGGATIPSSSVNTSYNTRKVMQLAEKDRIAQAMVAHIPDGATLFIDIGTTPEAVARALLNHNDLRIVTNNLNVAGTLMAKEDFRVILAGGEVRNRDGGIVGEATLDFVSQFRLDFGILGISGIELDGSLLDFDYHEVRVKQAIIENSRCVMLGVDHTKFGRNAMVNLGDISQIDMLFTDQEPPAELMQRLQECDLTMEIIN